LFDPLGGIKDAQSRAVRFIGDATARIEEDYLRILRLLRFSAHYSNGRHDEAALEACAAGREGLTGLSGERIQAEMFKLLSASRVVPSLMVMHAKGILDLVLPTSRGFDDLSALIALEEREDLSPDALLRLATLIDLTKASVEALTDRWKLSNASRDRLLALCQQKVLDAGVSEDDLKKQIYALGEQESHDRALLGWANAEDDTAWRHLVTLTQNWQRPVLPITGQDILDMGTAPGPDVGDRLGIAEAQWIESGFALSKDALMEMLSEDTDST
jgi:poly(A) polymerase